MDLNCIPRVTKFCCCISLRVGCLIIGYISLVLAAVGSALVSLSLVLVVYVVRAHKEGVNNHSPEETARVAIALYISHAYYLGLLLLHFGNNVLLVVSVHMSRHNWLRWHVILALVTLGLAMALVMLSSVFFSAVVAIVLLAWCLCLFYCVAVVRSKWLSVTEQEYARKPREMRTIRIEERPLPAQPPAQQQLLPS